MKKIVALFLIVAMLFNCTACAGKEPPNMEPQVSQMKAICELAVMECYYHNVAKYYEKDAVKGILGIGKKDKHFWIEYSGVVKLGIDASLVTIEVADTQVTVTIPEAKVLDCRVDSSSLSKDSFIVDKKSANIVADDEIKAYEEAQSKLEESASGDKVLLASAQQRAQSLLEEYIKNIGNAVDKQYSIKWVYVDRNGNSTNTNTVEPPTSEPEPEEKTAK